MSKSLLERRLIDVSDRLKRLRAEIAVADEQCAVLVGEAEDARLRSLVSETPLAQAEAHEIDRVIAPAGLADHHVTLFLEDLLEVQTDDRLVLGDHDAHRFGHRF